MQDSEAHTPDAAEQQEPGVFEQAMPAASGQAAAASSAEACPSAAVLMSHGRSCSPGHLLGYSARLGCTARVLSRRFCRLNYL